MHHPSSPAVPRVPRWRVGLSLLALLAVATQACMQSSSPRAPPSQGTATSANTTPARVPPPPPPDPDRPVVDPCECGPLDVVFAIDDTGSMGSSLSAFQAAFPQLLNEINQSSNGDYRLGLVTFQDSVTVLDDLAAGNDSSVSAHVAGLTAFGGGGWPEASDEALNTILNNLPARPGQPLPFSGYWRSGARRFVVLLTDAPPAGFDDGYTAGADDLNAHARALDAYNLGIKLHAVYVPTGGVAPATLAVMQDYAATSQGLFRQTLPDGSDVPQAVQDFLSGCRRPADVWMQDHPSDVGQEPHALSPIYQSPDIKVCNSASGCAAPGDSPVYGSPGLNHVFVTLRNDGPNVSLPGPASGSLYVYWTSAGGNAAWNTHWTPIGVQHGLYLAPGEHREVRIPWDNVPLPGHYCLLARWVSAGDPMSFPELIGSNTLVNTRNNNNIAWRNVNVIRTQPGTPTGSSFTLHFLDRRPATLRFTPERSIPGKVLVDLGPLFHGWKANGAKGWGFAFAEGTALFISPEGGALEMIPPAREGSAGRVELSFTLDKPGVWPLRISHTDPESGEELGGAEYRLSVVGPDEPATTPTVSARRDLKGVTTLSWSHDAHHVRYRIWRSESPDFRPGEGEVIGEVEARDADVKSALTSTDEGGRYFYRVQALTEAGSEAFSDRVSAGAAEGNEGR